MPVDCKDHSLLVVQVGVRILEVEEAGSVAAKDVTLCIFVDEGKIPDHTWCVEVPMRPIRRPAELILGVHHIEGDFRQTLIHRFHRLAREEHVAHVFTWKALQQRGLRRAHHVLMVEALHKEGHPSKAALDPDHLEPREPLRDPVDDPIGQMDDVAPGE
jgi:hypothetical protein